MPLPSVHKHDEAHWQKLQNEAQGSDGKAIIGALFLLAVEFQELREAVLEQRGQSKRAGD